MPSHHRKPHKWEGWQEEERPWGVGAVFALVLGKTVEDHVVLVVDTKRMPLVVALVPVKHA